MEWLQSAVASVLGGEAEAHADESATEDDPDVQLQSSGMLSKVRWSFAALQFRNAGHAELLI